VTKDNSCVPVDHQSVSHCVSDTGCSWIQDEVCLIKLVWAT